MLHRHLVAVSLLHMIIALGFFFAWSIGIVHEVFQADRTMLSSGILALFVIGAGNGLYTAYQHQGEPYEDVLAQHLASISLGLGLLGTIVGFTFMLGEVVALDPDDVVATRDALDGISTGMATALYTTGVGLVSQMALNTQAFIGEARL